MCRVDMTTSPFLINCSSSAEATLNEKEYIKNNIGKNSLKLKQFLLSHFISINIVEVPALSRLGFGDQFRNC